MHFKNLGKYNLPFIKISNRVTDFKRNSKVNSEGQYL